MQKDAFYFPHFSNARIDRKIRRMRKELGLEGYGIYFMILETLREQAEYNYPVEDIDLLADEFGTSEQKVRTVITNYELFTVDERNKFFSPKMIMYLQPYLEGKERKRIGGIRGNLIKYKHITSEQSKELSDDQILQIHSGLAMKKSLPSVCESESDRICSQIKVNKRKIKEIDKVNNESKKKKEPKLSFHDFDLVKLTQNEYDKCIEVYGEVQTIKALDKLHSFIGSSGKKYKSHYHTLSTWVWDSVKAIKLSEKKIQDDIMEGIF